MEYLYLNRPDVFWGRLLRYLIINPYWYMAAFLLAIVMVFIRSKRKTNFIIDTLYYFFVISLIFITVFSRKGNVVEQIELQWIPGITYFNLMIGKSTIYSLRECIYNIIMFIPYGVLKYCREKRIYMVIKGSAIISLLIETLQLIFQKGLFQVDDIINNTIGGILGSLLIVVCYLLFSLLRKIRGNACYGHSDCNKME